MPKPEPPRKENALTYVDVVYDQHGQPIKISLVRAVHATRRRLPSGTFGVEIEWVLGCPEGGEHHFTTVSKPRANSKAKTPSGVAKALNSASPIPRAATVEFSRGYGFRNWTESFNSWFKSRLGTTAGKSRAMRLAPEHQAVDHLCAGLLANYEELIAASADTYGDVVVLSNEESSRKATRKRSSRTLSSCARCPSTTNSQRSTK